MNNDPRQSEARVKRAWTVILAWIGGISAVLAFFGTVTGFFGNIQNHFHHNAQVDSQMAVAQSQARQGEYRASVQSYADILKTEPLYRPALDEQVQSTMLWVENYHVYLKPGEDLGAAVASQLDQIIAIFEAALVRTRGTAAADVQAHLGWTHWLNQHIAEREFPPNAMAERNYRAALATDPSNVYANAMLGNWLALNGGSLADAVQHFNSAVARGNARSFVRTLQLAGLRDRDESGSRTALVRALNEMRKNGEPLDAEDKHRIMGFCCDPSVTDHAELTESLSAVPAADAWKTYLWLDDQPNTGDEGKHREIMHNYIAANIAEVSGDKQKSLDEYRTLQEQLKGQRGTLTDLVDQAIARLSNS